MQGTEPQTQLVCEYCGQQFKRISGLNTHLRFKHADQLIDELDAELETTGEAEKALDDPIEALCRRAVHYTHTMNGGATAQNLARSLRRELEKRFVFQPVDPSYAKKSMNKCIADFDYGFRDCFDIPIVTIGAVFKSEMRRILSQCWPNVRRSRVRALIEGDFTGGKPVCHIPQAGRQQYEWRMTMLDLLETVQSALVAQSQDSTDQ